LMKSKRAASLATDGCSASGSEVELEGLRWILDSLCHEAEPYVPFKLKPGRSQMLRGALLRLAILPIALGIGSAADATSFIYKATLSGPAESPPNASPGTGSAIVTFDDVTHLFRVQVTFSGLLGTTAASHIHAPTAVPMTGTAGVATTVPTFPGFPLGVTSGTYDDIFDLLSASSYNPAYLAANGGTPETAEVALIGALDAGRAYLNVHTSLFPSGEIRGFLAAVPEPATWGMMLGGFGLVGGALRLRRRDVRYA
jgi:hypothetical protein